MSTFNEFLDGGLNQSFDEYLGGEAAGKAAIEKVSVAEGAKKAYEAALASAKAAYEKTLAGAKQAYAKASTVAKGAYQGVSNAGTKAVSAAADEFKKTAEEIKQNKALVIKVAVVSAVGTAAIIGLCAWLKKK